MISIWCLVGLFMSALSSSSMKRLIYLGAGAILACGIISSPTLFLTQQLVNGAKKQKPGLGAGMCVLASLRPDASSEIEYVLPLQVKESPRANPA